MIRVVSLQKWCREALCPHAFKNVEIRTEAGWRVDQHHRRRRPLGCGLISSRRRSRTRLKVTRKPRLAAIIAGGAFAESCSGPRNRPLFKFIHFYMRADTERQRSGKQRESFLPPIGVFLFKTLTRP